MTPDMMLVFLKVFEFFALRNPENRFVVKKYVTNQLTGNDVMPCRNLEKK